MHSLSPRACSGRVLVVDDDPVTRHLFRAWLEPRGFTVLECETGWEAVSAARDADVVCLDLGLGDISGNEVLAHLKAEDADVTVIIATANDDLATAVDLMRRGAYDYVTKPLDRHRLEQVVMRGIERRQLLRRVKHDTGRDAYFGSIVGRSPAMEEVASQIRNVLGSDIAVCVQGESGSGKELVARVLHTHGKRSAGPFVAVNCAAIPASLQESELFGHERGAFTGATNLHKGRFEQASGGTLFLDEIGEMSLSTQAALLRSLQEKSIRRVGGSADIPIDVRIVCATHRDLEREVEAGRFRQDLYFRLVGYPIHVPALRDRPTDVPLLVASMLPKLRADVGRDVTRVSVEAMEALMRYSWPGNVRELQNVIHRAMLAAPGDCIDLAHLPTNVKACVLPQRPSPAEPTPAVPAASVPEEPILPLRELERRAIARALRATGGSVGKAARLLELGRATLYRRLAELQLEDVAAPPSIGKDN